MKKIAVALALMVAVSVSISAQEKTKVNDQAAAQMLLGKHRLSLQWVSWDYFGTAGVTNRGGVYKILGSQRGRGKASSDFVQINGTITAIDTKEFRFHGEIITQVSHINGGSPCSRVGAFTFKITSNRKYWRLQQMDNPCDQVTDYVDIYFK